MNELRFNIQKHKKFLWVLALAYIAFNGCFVFPFSNEMFPFDFSKALLVIFGYGMIGMVYVGLLDKGKGISVLVLTLVFTMIGLMGRYLLEFGEVSNAMNFTPVNVVLYLIFVPMYCTLVYWAIWKWHVKIRVI